MLISTFTSPRRLALLAVAAFIAAIILIRSTSYNEYLPRYDLPGWPSHGDEEQKSSLEEDQQAPGRVETASASASADGSRYQGAEQRSSSSADATITAIPSGSTISTSSVTVLSASTTTSEEFVIVTGSGHQFRVYPDRTSDLGEIPTEQTSSTSIDPEATPTLTSNSTTVEPVDTSQHEHNVSQHMTYDQVQDTIKSLIKSWQPVAIEGHEPPYEPYRDRDYDPNLWEGFGYDNDFYINNGVKKLQEDHPGVQPEQHLPYPASNTSLPKSRHRGDIVPCEGARGKLLNDSVEDVMRVWPALPNGFPNAAIGEADAVGIDSNKCLDRFNRFGPYGCGQGERNPVDGWKRPVVRIDWSGVHWGQLQDQCLIANEERFSKSAREPTNLTPGKEMPKDDGDLDKAADAANPKYQARTAVLLRTWEGYNYTENDLMSIRAMVTELSLLSGGEYQVFLLVALETGNDAVFDNETMRDDILKRGVPRELRDIAILWDEKLLQEWYRKVGEWGVRWMEYMPVQWFSEMHPEFDFVWNWEPDTRYTGNHYEFLEAVADFARKVPRKYLWERNQRFFIPAAGYGTYDEFVNDTVRAVDAGKADETLKTVWGPQPYGQGSEHLVQGPVPPTKEEDDSFEWGVDEPADLITLSPIFDPTRTEWQHKDKIWNYVTGVRPHFTDADPEDKAFVHPNSESIPRRASIGTLVRMSRKLLHTMHLANVKGKAMASEMWPSTIALQHGLKAVYVPHPIWTDRNWPAWYADAVLNSNANKPAQWGQQADSVYNTDRSHNLAGLSYALESEFPTVLYRRWLGFPAYEEEPVSPIDGLGGKTFEEKRFIVDLGNGAERGDFVGGKGRMCLPPMLLHPVRKVQEMDEPGEREFMEPGGR